MGMDQTLIGFAVTKGGDIANEVWKDCGSIENPIGMAVALGQATGTILSKLRDTLGPDVLADFLVAFSAMASQAGELDRSKISLVVVEKE